jgi:hypothetical protein
MSSLGQLLKVINSEYEPKYGWPEFYRDQDDNKLYGFTDDPDYEVIEALADETPEQARERVHPEK